MHLFVQGARRTSDVETPRHSALLAGASPTASAAPQRIFTLSYAGAFVARIELMAPPLTPLPPGSQVAGIVHLTAPAGTGDIARCHEVGVALESEEVLAPAVAARSARRGTPRRLRRLASEQALCTHDARTAAFLLSVPHDAAPSFRTSAVAHQWRLRFELRVTAPRGRPGEVPWQVPLLVLPDAPPPAMAA